jgi:hypothetical protein
MPTVFSRVIYLFCSPTDLLLDRRYRFPSKHALVHHASSSDDYGITGYHLALKYADDVAGYQGRAIDYLGLNLILTADVPVYFDLA